MRITYDPDGNILYFKLREGAALHGEPLPDREDIIIDFDEADCPIGKEVMNISDLLGGAPAGMEIELPTASRPI